MDIQFLQLAAIQEEEHAYRRPRRREREAASTWLRSIWLRLLGYRRLVEVEDDRAYLWVEARAEDEEEETPLFTCGHPGEETLLFTCGQPGEVISTSPSLMAVSYTHLTLPTILRV